MTTVIRRRRTPCTRAAIAALVLAAAVAGCSGGTDPAASAPASTAAPTTATPTGSSSPTATASISPTPAPARARGRKPPAFTVADPKLTAASGRERDRQRSAWKFATSLSRGWAVNPDLILAYREDVTAKSFTGLTKQMSPAAAKDFKRLFALAKKQPDSSKDGPINALALWGHLGDSSGWLPDRDEPVGPIHVSGSVKDAGGSRIKVTQKIKTTLYGDKFAQRYRVSYVKTITYTLTGRTDHWKLHAWRAHWDSGKTVPAT